MKTAQLIAIGVVASSMSFIAFGSPAPSAALVHKKKVSQYEARPPVFCLIGTETCSAKNDPPVKACQLGTEKSESCATDGVKAIDATVR
jgi:hypothetical protein